MIRRIASLALAAGLMATLMAAASASPSIAQAPAPDRATAGQAIDWSRCHAGDVPASARCGWVTVPRDWAAPATSGTYRIRVVRIPATGQSLGALTFNPGGPGASGIETGGIVYSLLPESIRRSFDFIAWDPRGVGQSQPRLRTCTWEPPDLPPTGPVDATDIAQRWVDAVSSANAECLRLNRAYAGTLGTWQVIRDLDAIRKALGEDQISLWGMSYGTTIGRAYAQAFPQRLRALVLDGAIDPAPSIHSYMREHIWDDATGVQRMLGAFGGRYVKTYERAMRFLERRTLRFAGGRQLDRWEFVEALRGSAAYQASWGDVLALLDDVGTALDSQRARTRERGARIDRAAASAASPDPLVPRRTGDRALEVDLVLTLVNCTDMHDRPSVDSLAAAGTEAMGVGGTPYLLAVLVEGAQCSGVPALGRALPGLHSVLRLTPRPVIVSSVGDNLTPYLGARELANAFASAPMVVYDGTQHVAYSRTSPCIDAPVTRYFLTQQLPPRSTACPLEWRRPK